MHCSNYSFSLSFAGTATQGNSGVDGQKLEIRTLRHTEDALGSE